MEQTEADVPTVDDWLSPNEQALLNAMRFAKRRSDWRLGRWTAKNALALYFLYLKLPADPQVLASIEIRSASTGAPEAYFGNQPAAATISLSHRAGIAACAVTMPGVELGCDLEMVEPRSDAFVADYFTTASKRSLRKRVSQNARVSWRCFGALRKARSRPCMRVCGLTREV